MKDAVSENRSYQELLPKAQEQRGQTRREFAIKNDLLRTKSLRQVIRQLG